MIALVVFTDGRRDCIARTIPSALANLRGPIIHRLIYDDSGDNDYRDWLAMRFCPQGFSIFWHEEGRQGFGGAIRYVWECLARAESKVDYVFHLEDDFTFNRKVDVHAMMNTLDAHPHLAQMALRRQPWNAVEVAAGGVVEANPDAFVQHTGGYGTWLEHREFFTTNPSLYRRSLIERDWPAGDQSEGRFALDLFQDPTVRCGYWGSRDSGEAVHHIGGVRTGVGY